MSNGFKSEETAGHAVGQPRTVPSTLAETSSSRIPEMQEENVVEHHHN